jgi:hypothetical protein
MVTQRPSFRSTLRVLCVSAVNNTSTAATPRARSGGAQRSHGRLDGAAHVAESGRLARHGRSRLFQTKLINIRADPSYPCRSVFYSAIHTPLRRTIGPATTIQRLQRNTKQHTKRRFSVLSSRFSVPGSRFSVLSSRFSVLGSQFSVLSSRFSVLGSRFSVLSSRFSVLGSRFSVLGSRFSVLSSQFSVLGSQFLVLSSRFLVLGSWFSVLSSRFSLFTPHAAPAPATFAPCAMPGTAPPAAQQRRPLPPPAQTARRSTRRAASSRTSGG